MEKMYEVHHGDAEGEEHVSLVLYSDMKHPESTSICAVSSRRIPCRLLQIGQKLGSKPILPDPVAIKQSAPSPVEMTSFQFWLPLETEVTTSVLAAGTQTLNFSDAQKRVSVIILVSRDLLKINVAQDLMK